MIIVVPFASLDIHGTNGDGSVADTPTGPTLTATANSLRTALTPLNTPLVGGTSE